MYDLKTQANDQYELEKDRNLALSGDVVEKNCAKLVQQIIEINIKDDAMEALIPTYVREPIKLVIDSCGGSCYDGNGLNGAILASKTPVWTYCYSKAMSMGQLAFICGEKRFIGQYATIMYHGVSTGARGYLPDVKHTLEEAERLEEGGTSLTVKRTKVSREKLESIIEKKTEWYINATDALEYGFATDLL